jgi:hypothetical protein
MSFWSRITGAISRAGDAIRHVGQSAAGQVARTSTTAYDFSRDSGTQGGLAIRDRSGIFTHGWQQVYSGDMQSGFTNVGFGMAQLATGSQPSAWVAEQYRDTLGDAFLWAQQQALTTQRKVCFSALCQNVKAGLAKRKVSWADAMAADLRGLIQQNNMDSIDLGC